MSDNGNLTRARKMKNDEFYTRLCDVRDEMSNYVPYFLGKTVYCNCDDPAHSVFWRYFHENFSALSLSCLIATHYGSIYTYEMEYSGGCDDDLMCGVRSRLSGDGDFRSSECIELLRRCDIVVTNSPFSLAREYLPLLIDSGKQFLVVSNLNAITDKSVFPSIMQDKVWLGCTCPTLFMTPYGSMKHVGTAVWFTNLDHPARHVPLALTRRYSANPDMYRLYDGTDIINVDHTRHIPMDYYGIMGVPISYLTKYCPEQFRILGTINHGSGAPWDLCKCAVDGKAIYKRITIQRIQ